jgi:hypothetical protein
MIRLYDEVSMEDFNGCQIPNLRKFAEGKADFEPQPFSKRFKRALAKPWNYHIKRYIKRWYTLFKRWFSKIEQKNNNSVASEVKSEVVHLQTGDWVRVRSLEEIQETLNPFKELKGCAFLEDMKQYCGTRQRVFKVMERFLDERDYKVKKTKGIVLLEGVFCQGTPVFGRCDRSCLSFWREEWLEKLIEP